MSKKSPMITKSTPADWKKRKKLTVHDLYNAVRGHVSVWGRLPTHITLHVNTEVEAQHIIRVRRTDSGYIKTGEIMTTDYPPRDSWIVKDHRKYDVQQLVIPGTEKF